MGSRLQHATHSDTHSLTSPSPKMILLTYKIDVHPGNGERDRPVDSMPGPGRVTGDAGRRLRCAGTWPGWAQSHLTGLAGVRSPRSR